MLGIWSNSLHKLGKILVKLSLKDNITLRLLIETA